MKNLSKKHLKHLWNRYLFYSNYYNEEILKPEDLSIHQWIEEAYILMAKERFEADIDYFIDLRSLSRRSVYALPAFFKEDSK